MAALRHKPACRLLQDATPRCFVAAPPPHHHCSIIDLLMVAYTSCAPLRCHQRRNLHDTLGTRGKGPPHPRLALPCPCT
eukprot:537763-Prorocentrum_lima.AAC.1